MILEIYQDVIYFLHLTVTTDLLWVVFPLAVATIIMIVYFERYKDERPGWNTYVANSLVLLFVSVILFRYIYSIDGKGLANFVNFPIKYLVSSGVLLIGVIILFLNFKHYLPEKIAGYLSSPLTLNLIAYVAVLYVYSETSNWNIFFSLMVLLVLLLVIFNLVKIPIRGLFLHLKEMKEKEKVEEIIEEKKPIEEKKKELKKEEKLIKRGRLEVKKVEKKVRKEKLKELEKQKKEVIKLKKIVGK